MINYKKIYKSALPLSLASLSIVLMGILDAAMVGRLGVVELAIAALAVNLYFIFAVFGEGFVMPFGPKLATALESKGAITIVIFSTLVACILYYIVARFILYFSEEILIAFHQEAYLSQEAHKYINIVSYTLILTLIFAMFWEFYAAIEKTNIMMWTSFMMVCCNFILNYILIYGNFGFDKLGVIGSAWATLLSLIAAIVVLFLVSWGEIKKVANWPTKNQIKPIKTDAIKYLRDGVFSGINQVSAVGFIIFSSFLVGTYGVFALSANTVVFQTSELAIVFAFGFADIAAIFCAQAIANSNRGELKEVIVKTMKAALLIMLTIVVALMVFRQHLIHIFLNVNDSDFAQTYDLFLQFSMVGFPLLLITSASVVLLGISRGFDDYAVPLRISVFGYWIFGVITQFVLLKFSPFGSMSVWIGLFATMTLILMLQIIRTIQLFSKAE
jgi:MATE family multidrug resistance protein